MFRLPAQALQRVPPPKRSKAPLHGHFPQCSQTALSHWSVKPWDGRGAEDCIIVDSAGEAELGVFGVGWKRGLG